MGLKPIFGAKFTHILCLLWNYLLWMQDGQYEVLKKKKPLSEETQPGSKLSS